MPVYKVYEDEHFLAFLDIIQLNKGFTLLVPKKHYRWVWDYPNVGEYFETANKIVHAMRRVFDTESIIGLIVGEEVPHAHIKLLPRTKDDGHGGFINQNIRYELTEKEMSEIAKKISDALN